MAQTNHQSAVGLDSPTRLATVNWSVADRPNGMVYRYSNKPGELGARHAAKGAASSAPCGSLTPPCDPPLAFSANDEVMGGSTPTPGHATIVPI